MPGAGDGRRQSDLAQQQSPAAVEPRRAWRRGGILALALSLCFGLIFAAVAWAAAGDLTQKPDPDGCIVNALSTDIAGCTNTGKALNGAFSVTVSADGTSAYVASVTSSAVAVFERNTTTGKLTQKADPDGCIVDAPSTDIAGCTNTGKALDNAFSVTVSPDGTSAYVASAGDSAVAVFDRDVPPTTTITSGPDGRKKNSSPSFGFEASEPSTFECALDSGPFAPCTSPKSYSDLADGDHTFKVRATDSGGNTEDPPAERSFTVDTTVDGSASAKKKQKQKQKGKKIVVKAKVKANEDLEAQGKGKIKVAKKSYKLKPQTKSVSSGSSKNLKLKPKKSKDAKKIAKALKKGKKAKAKLTVKMTDDLGNKKSQKLSVKLKR